MKILFFHLMPYNDLPSDFAEHHKSAWIDVDPKLFDAGKAHVAFHEYLDEMQFADELGFDGICVNEHHSNAYGKLGYLMVGTPDEVASQLKEAATNLNSGQLMVMLHFGNMNRDTAFYNSEMFARYVKPQIADMWESEWENRWWPKPLLDEPQRAVPRPISPEARTGPGRPIPPLGAAA